MGENIEGADGMKLYGVAMVLGTPYQVYLTERKKGFKKIDGVCKRYSREIVVVDIMNDKLWADHSEEERVRYMKRVIRHEIIHAFVHESGLSESSFGFKGSWAMNEEMVDWMAEQLPKMWKVFKALDLLK